MAKLDPQAALVVFSGGQDSTTCLAWALSRFKRVETIGFRYRQRHAVELTVRKPLRVALSELRPDWRRRLGKDHLLSIDALATSSISALTTKSASKLVSRPGPDRLPATFVPGRNLVFLMFAAIVANDRGLKHIIGGMCETDFSGYPDCRDDTIKALQAAINLGMESRVVLHTPLMWIDKAATWELAETLGGQALLDLIVEKTHTCYAGNRHSRQDWGYGCGKCAACKLRENGWRTFKMKTERK